MTARDWQNSIDPLAMLEAIYPLRGMDSVEPQSRKSRLYLLACARQAWDRLPGICRVLHGLAERIYAEKGINKELRNQVYLHAESLIHCRGEVDDINAIGEALVALGHAKIAEVKTDLSIDPHVWAGYAHLVYGPFDKKTPSFPRIPVEFHSAHLVREIFGNPLVRVPPFDPQWRTETVVHLAQHANSSGDFGMLPILADALQDVGCDREDVLDHLRHGAQHSRWCWVLETILSHP